MDSLQKRDTRSGFGDGLLELGHINPDVFALCADLTGSLKMGAFRDAFPDRFLQMGVAEANMMGVAAGLATGGKIPYTGTFANFSTGRVYDQLRQSIAYSGKNVKVCASHAGLTLGEDGATHQILEDVGMVKMLPHFSVVVPCDYNQTRAATIAIAAHDGPVYLRFGRPKWPVFTHPDEPFILGAVSVLRGGGDVTLIATGHMVWKALQAADVLKNDHGMEAEVLNVHTIKPLDNDTILNSLATTGCGVVCEEHQRLGGLGETVSAALVESRERGGALLAFVAVKDSFGESGTPEELMIKYGLESRDIVDAALGVAGDRSGS